MAVEFEIKLLITATTEAELLDAFEYFVTNYAQKTVSAGIAGPTLTHEITIVETGTAATRSTIIALKTHFGALLGQNYWISPRIGASP